MQNLLELAQTFNQQYQEHFKTVRRIKNKKTGQLMYVSTWQRISDFLKENSVPPIIYFGTLFHYRKSKGLKDAKSHSVNWYGSDQAFEIFQRHSARINNNYSGGGALATDRDSVVSAVNTGLRMVLHHVKTYVCGLKTRRLLVAQLPTTFLAVDVYWPQVAESAPQRIVEAVTKERARLMHNPTLWQAAQETYNDWQRLAC